MVKEQQTVKNASSRDGSIQAWLHSGGRPVVINTPDGLKKKLKFPLLTGRNLNGGGAQHIPRQTTAPSTRHTTLQPAQHFIGVDVCIISQ